MPRKFLSGDEAVAEGIRLAQPDVISAYPITPQTVTVERLSEFVANGELESHYMYVESEHSALAAAIGVSAAGARAFTATSSQGLLYMAECLTYASGGRFPIVMMNANRATALPWNIYGDQRDSIALLDHGWIQAYAEDAQEALDLCLMAYKIAEHPDVLTPFMINLDGFALTHTFESVDVPDNKDALDFVGRYEAFNCFSFDEPKNIGYSAGPAYNKYFKYDEHLGMNCALKVIDEVERDFEARFGRSYPGALESYRMEDTELCILTLGSISGLVRECVDIARERGIKLGLVKLRYLRPLPSGQLAQALAGIKALCVLEKDISFGAEGTVFTNIKSVLYDYKIELECFNVIAGLGGDDILPQDIKQIVNTLVDISHNKPYKLLQFLGIDTLQEG